MQAFRNLDYESAWGFQTAGCNSVDYYYYHDNAPEHHDESLEFVATETKVDAFVKLLGYVPFLGIGVGIYRIRLFSNSNDPNKLEHIIRGIAEIIPGVGFLLAFPDFFVTVYRLINYRAVVTSSIESEHKRPRPF